MKSEYAGAEMCRPVFLSSHGPAARRPLEYVRHVAKAYDSVAGGPRAIVAGLSQDGFCAGWEDEAYTVAGEQPAGKPGLGHAIEFVNSYVCTHINIHCWCTGTSNGPCTSVLQFARTCAKPFILTPHGVSSNPSPKVRQSLSELTSLASTVVAKAPCDEHILHTVYGVPRDKVTCFPHRIDSMESGGAASGEDRIPADAGPVILTLDLPEESARVDVALEALPHILQKYPGAVQVVATAPSSAFSGRPGRPSREELKARAAELGVAEHLLCVESPLSLFEFHHYVRAADLCLTPFEEENRHVARDMAYLLAAGKPLLSMPFTSAGIVACAGAAELANFEHAQGLSDRILELVGASEKKSRLQKNAAKIGKDMLNKEMGEGYYRLFMSLPDPDAADPHVSAEEGHLPPPWARH